MNEEKNIRAHDRRRSGGASVTLLFVAALAAAACIAASRMFLEPVDTTAAFVPDNAVFYAHANGPAATEALLSSSVQMPSGVRPDEVAVFIVPGDDMQRRGTILAWKKLKPPSPDELRRISERNIDGLDENHYLIHDGTLATASRVAAAAHASIADDHERMAALALLRSAFSLQIYARPDALLTPAGTDIMNALSDKGVEPLVAGVSLRNGSFMARLLPLKDAADRGSILGYRASSERPARPSAGRLAADVTVTENAPSFDMANLLFRTSSEVNAHPDPALLSDAGVELRSSLASPYALWLWTDPATGKTSYLLDLPGLAPAAVKRSVGRYYAAARPEHSNLALPDGDIVVEYRLAEDTAAVNAGDAVIGGTDEKVVIGPDDGHGSLMASDERLLADFRAQKDDAPDTTVCPTGALRSTVNVSRPELWAASLPSVAKAANTYGVHDLMLGLTVDNEVFICGYLNGSVDN
ncbi:MAG TPA: hypothetical protein VL500_07050 [Candidatus Eisenbacteria bacterium]|nr:hypothetical protein [Candidatus Eisenbacteria bacterium]